MTALFCLSHPPAARYHPPLLNVGRYQRRIVTSMSESLGRPVHLDKVTLHLLPMPGFTLDNFVVSEDPAFGNEPTSAPMKSSPRSASVLSGIAASSSPT